MIYIVHDGTVITGVYSGSAPPVEGIPMPDVFDGRTGDPIKFFDGEWKRKPLVDLYKEGFVIRPQGMVMDYESGTWREATHKELAELGELPITNRHKFDENGVLDDKSLEELVEEGIATEEEQRTYKRSKIRHRLRVIDREAARPLRAILAGKETEFDHQKLAALEAEAETLRAELADLGG